jgi:hypothetical protein
MIMKLSSALLLACGLSLVGCGSITVSVDVLNPQVIEAEMDRRLERDLLPEVLAQWPDGVKRKIETLQNEWAKVVIGLSIVQTEGMSKDRAKAESERAKIQIRYGKAWAETFNEATWRLTAYAKTVRAITDELRRRKVESGVPSSKSPEDREYASIDLDELRALRFTVLRDYAAGMSALVARVSASQEQMAGMMAKMRSARAGSASGSSSGSSMEKKKDEQDIRTAKGAGAAFQNFAQNLKRTLLRGQSLIESKYAYAVASAHRSMWKKHYGRTHAQGLFGNTDIALKMESVGEFTLKGVAFDPSDTARVAAKVGVQAILLATQMAGVPTATVVPDGSTMDGAAMARSTGELQRTLLQNQKIKARTRGQRQALHDLGQAITHELARIAPEPVEIVKNPGAEPVDPGLPLKEPAVDAPPAEKAAYTDALKTYREKKTAHDQYKADEEKYDRFMTKMKNRATAMKHAIEAIQSTFDASKSRLTRTVDAGGENK